MIERPDQTSTPAGGAQRWAYALVPVLLLLLLVAALGQLNPLAGLRADAPPIESLSFDRVVLQADPKEIVLTIVNGGPDTVTVAQVIVDDAFWPYSIEPSSPIDPLRSATIRLAYPWVHGEPHEVAILTSTGLTFLHTIEVALASPSLTGRIVLDLALLGAFVGFVPVIIGLCWYPLIRQSGSRFVNLLLAFTVGILIFLAFDATLEALDLAPRVPIAFDGIAVFFVGLVLSLATLIGIGSALRRRRPGLTAVSLAGLIALGIGLHNFGEGLAISAAYSLGEVALTSLLIVGFAIHNSTEGVAIVAPLSSSRPSVGLLALLGILAGGPTIAGTWLGAFAYSPMMAILFLGLGVGAIAQVVWEVVILIHRRGDLGQPVNVAGVAAGVLTMYLTALIVSI